MEDNIIDQIDDEILNPPPYNPDYQPGLNNAVNHYLRLDEIEDEIEEIPRVHVRPEIRAATTMLVLNNRRHNNRIITRPQIHVQNTSPILGEEQNIQTIKQEHNTTKPKKRVKPSSDF